MEKGDFKLPRDLGTRFTLEDAVDGLFRLFTRLGAHDPRQRFWMQTWWDRDFDRKATAARLGIPLKTLNKRIERVQKEYERTEPKLPRGSKLPFLRQDKPPHEPAEEE